MRVLLVIPAALFVVALSLGTALAVPSLTAPDTGLVDIPTAQVQGSLSFSLAAAWQDLEGDANALPIRAVVGLMGSTEIGAAWNRMDFDALDDNIVGLAAKHQLMRESSVAPALAVGVRYGKLGEAPSGFLAGLADLAGGTLDATATSVYLVASKTLKQSLVAVSMPQVTGHAGVSWQRLKATSRAEPGGVPVTISETSNQTSMFAGLEIASPKGTSLAVEYRTRPQDGGKAVTSALLRQPLAAGLSAQVGWTNAVPGLSAAADDHNFFVGLAFSPRLP